MGRFKKASDIKTGVVGYGAAFQIGRVHLGEMQQAGMMPAAVAEVDPVRRKAAMEEFPGLQAYASVGEMLRKADVDLVAVLTPHNTHAKLAMQCLRAGRHVVCEKPFAITTAECDAMIREARNRKMVLSTYHNRHWDGCILEAVKRIRKQEAIGEVYRIEAHMGGFGAPGDWWRSSKSISGGILYDWGVHLLEYSLQLIDSKIVEVAGFAKAGHWAAKTAWGKDTNEDEATAVVRFANGALLSLRVSRLDSNPSRGMLEITGTGGSYIMEGQTYEIIKHRGKERVVSSGQNVAGQWGCYYQNVADHLTRGVPLIITPEWARRPIHILDLADRSIRAGKAQKAKYS